MCGAFMGNLAEISIDFKGNTEKYELQFAMELCSNIHSRINNY